MGEDLQKAIRASGNNLHLKVINLLEKNWQVEVSPYYVDDITDKPREIDIIASRTIFLTGFPWKKTSGDFKVFLYIECKHFKNDIAFWVFKNKEPGNLLKTFSISDHSKPTASGGINHYFTDKVCKLSTSVNEDKDILDALLGPIKALIDHRENDKPKGVFYPISVYEGIRGIYLINNSDDLNNLKNLNPVKNAIAELTYSYKGRRNNNYYQQKEKFAVDIVGLDYLEKLLKAIEKEVEFIRRSECIACHIV